MHRKELKMLLEKSLEEYRTTSSLGWWDSGDEFVVEDEDGNEYLAVKDGQEIVLLVCYYTNDYLTPDDYEYGELCVAVQDVVVKYEYAENNLYRCENCCKWFDPEDEGVLTEDGCIFCDDCVQDGAAYQCEECGGWFSASYKYSRGLFGLNTDGEEIYICDHCRESYYICGRCGCIVHMDEARYSDDSPYVFCENCYEEIGGDVILGYHDYYSFDYYVKVSRQKDPLISPEWEIDCGGLNGKNARLILDAIGGDDYVVAMRDGSLNDGFEVIPAPADLYHHLNVFNWREGMATALRLGYRAHDPGTCGLHVHIDREFFSDTELSQDRIEDMFWISLFNNLDWIKKFSRRKDYCYCRITDDTGEKLDTVEKAEEKVKKISKFDRYQAINLSKSETIEIRIFRGTCNIETFYATLEMVDIWARLIKEARTIQKAMAITLDDFVKQAKKRNYKAFLNYLERIELIDENTGF